MGTVTRRELKDQMLVMTALLLLAEVLDGDVQLLDSDSERAEERRRIIAACTVSEVLSLMRRTQQQVEAKMQGVSRTLNNLPPEALGAIIKESLTRRTEGEDPEKG